MENKKISHGFCGLQIAEAGENGDFGEYIGISGAVALNLTPKTVIVNFTGLDLAEYAVYEKLIGYTGTLEIALITPELETLFSGNGKLKFFSLKFKDTDTEHEYHYCYFPPCGINLSTDTNTASYNTFSIPIEIYTELPPDITGE